MEVELKEISLPTPSGHSLSVSKFVPQGTANYTLVISSATGVLQKYYSRYAHFMASKGMVVYTFDYHGIGKSENSIKDLKKNKSTATSWGQNDQAAVTALAKKENPDAQLILIAHSIGGQLLGFNPNCHLLDKVILVASQSGYWTHFEGLHKVKMLLFWFLILPISTHSFGYFPAKIFGLFENLPKQMALEWGGWGKQPDYLMHFYNKETYFFEEFEVPILSLSFSRDSYAPKTTVDWLAKLFKNAVVKRVHHHAVKGERHVKHFGFFKSWAQQPYWEQSYNFIINGNYET